MKFGEYIRRLREERHLLLQELANRAGFSAATASQVERGVLIPTDDTAKKLIDALEKAGKIIDDEVRNNLYHTLERERLEREHEPRQSLAFGTALDELLKQLNLSGSDLKSRPRSTINAWVTGRLLPNDKTLVEELLPELERLGASKTDLGNLEIAHLQDLLSKTLKLVYLTEEDQKRVMKIALSEANRVLVPQGLITHARKMRERLLPEED